MYGLQSVHFRNVVPNDQQEQLQNVFVVYLTTLSVAQAVASPEFGTILKDPIVV
jgi:hypothetical protein